MMYNTNISFVLFKVISIEFFATINLEYTIDLAMVIDILLIKIYVTLISFETTNLVEVIVM